MADFLCGARGTSQTHQTREVDQSHAKFKGQHRGKWSCSVLLSREVTQEQYCHNRVIFLLIRLWWTQINDSIQTKCTRPRRQNCST